MTPRAATRWAAGRRRPAPASRPNPARLPACAGAAAIELVAGLALVLAPMVALATMLPQWAETRYAVEAAAVEAGRLAARTGQPSAAEKLGRQVLANHGIDTGVAVDVTVPTDPAGRPARRGEVRAEVAAAVPAVGAFDGWTLTRAHREPLDPWRGRHPNDG
jgi:hypothetical protein